MMTLASQTDISRVARADLDIRAAHFDVAVASAVEFRATPTGSSRPVDMLVEGLSSRNKSAVLLDCAYSGKTGLADHQQPEALDRGTIVHKIVALPSSMQFGENGQRFDGNPDPVFYAAMKLLCFDDRLFNLNGGSDYVRTSVSAARRAGRITALLCTDLSTAFSKRREITDSFGGSFDLVIGEPAAVLSLFGVSRIDTLVPKLIRRGTGLLLHRIDFAPIYIRPRSTAVAVGKTPMSAAAFWSQFVPSAFDELLTPGPRTA